MANLADITDNHDFTDESLRRQLSKNPAGALLATRGVCLNCDEKIEDPKLYCDVDCRADFEIAESVSRNTRR